MKRFFKYIKKFWVDASLLKRVTILFILVLSFTLMASTFGRYIYLEVRDFYLASKNFYFYSDKLDSSIKRYTIDNWSGVEDYPIVINMNNYLNNKKYSSSDIYYDVNFNCSTNVICTSNIGDGSRVILSESHTDSFQINVRPNAEFHDGDNAWLEVYASSTVPYVKSLSGRFVLNVGKIGTTYKINDSLGSPYFDLIVTNTLDYYTVNQSFGDYAAGHRLDINTYMALSDVNKSKCSSVITNVSFNPNVTILDMTNQNYLDGRNITSTTIGGYQYINGFTFDVDALSSTTVRFYKKNTLVDYTYPLGSSESIIDVSFD